MQRADWYFDFISPFAYVQHVQMAQVEKRAQIRRVPILFAALLNHWGHKGPAEIPKKRIFTYEYVQWYARRHNIPFTFPAAHPFNPLPALRLALVCDCRAEAVGRIFHYLWGEGKDLTDQPSFQALATELGLDNVYQRIADPAIKTTLRHNTQQALASGLFGVPSFLISDRLFWGNDSTEMVLDYLADPVNFEKDLAPLADVPEAVRRKGADG